MNLHNIQSARTWFDFCKARWPQYEWRKAGENFQYYEHVSTGWATLYLSNLESSWAREFERFQTTGEIRR